MKLRFISFMLVTILILVSAISTQAQGGNNMNANTSSHGGSYGSPGMSGATANTTVSRSSQSFGGIDYSMPSADGSFSGGGNTNSGSRPTGGNGRNGGNGGRGAGVSFNFGGSTGENSFSSLFGEQGMFTQGQRSRDSLSWQEFGGFGSQTSTATAPPAGIPEGISNTAWQPPAHDELPISGAPSILENNEALIQAQQQTWQNESPEIQDNAQQIYDQFWSDYYTAVDYAAQTYYDSVSTSVDYAYTAYISAVDYTTAQIDYYVDYAEEYAQWCYYYPWECYSYVYDEISQTYVNIESVSDVPATTVTLEEFWIDWSSASTDPASTANAYTALVVFANDQLGITVQPLYAGDATYEIQIILQNLPEEAEAYAALLSSMEGAYWGIFNGGVGVVGDINCTNGCSNENIPAELSDASAGVYMLNVVSPMPQNDASALDLITAVYPRLNGLEFAAITDVETGYAYMATAFGVGVDDNGQSVAVPKLIVTGVMQVNGLTTVYATVAVGQASIDAYYNLTR